MVSLKTDKMIPTQDRQLKIWKINQFGKWVWYNFLTLYIVIFTRNESRRNLNLLMNPINVSLL